MKKSMSNYIDSIDKIIKNKNSDNFDKVIEEHLSKVSFYQHERLIHLLITILFALLTLISLFCTVYSPRISLLLLTILLLCLLVPYIFHYYFLENGVQKMYVQYDELSRLKDKNNTRK